MRTVCIDAEGREIRGALHYGGKKLSPSVEMTWSGGVQKAPPSVEMT
ncbi:hypothetical protein [Edaphobacter sp.]|nr:hypothetical protein [Edaphobacter sp.]HEU5340723.1 hypothetical protein [Edaphobacter sp.]